MTSILSNNELNQSLVLLLQEVESKRLSWLVDPFTILYNHGFRVGELYTIQDWEFISPTQVRCITLKGSLDRIVNINELPLSVHSSILDNKNYVVTVSKSALERAMYSNMTGGRFLVKSKNISTHLFRHNYIKKLHDSGLSIDAIKAITGLKNSLVVSNYISSEIYQLSH